MLSRIIKALSAMFGLTLLILSFDLFLRHAVLNFAYPEHFQQENNLRYPFPYEMFRSRPNWGENNRAGFKGRLFGDGKSGAFRIAFFGGSTGYNGDPTIAERVETILQNSWGRTVEMYNFSVVSSNHRQHVHSIVENLWGNSIDLVIFYGGHNEVLQARYYDPRPGYPYNYFYRAEVSPGIKFLMENSAIVGLTIRLLESDRLFFNPTLTRLQKLRLEQRPFSKEWEGRVIREYLKTLEMARSLTHNIESDYCGRAEFIAFIQPMNYVSAEDIGLINRLRASASKIKDVIDLFDVEDVEFTDVVHVTQRSRGLMAAKIAFMIQKHTAIEVNCGIQELHTE